MKTKQSKLGLYSVIISVIVIAVAIVVNMIVSAIPSRYTKYEINGLDLYEITGETEKIVKAIKEDINIYVVVSEGMEDDRLNEFCERYTQLNKKLKLKLIDPVVTPALTTSNGTEHSLSEMSDNTIIVSSSLRDKVITESEIYTSDHTDEELMYYQMMGYSVTNTKYFNGEQMLTSALDYVTLDMISALYYTVDHGEAALGSILQQYIDAENYNLSELSLLTERYIPENASAVIINSPKSDITDDELEMFEEYIENGGKMILITDYADDFYSLENFKALTEFYGMKALEGRVVETDSGMYAPEGELFIPALNTSNEITAAVEANKNSYPLILQGPQSGFVFTEEFRKGISVEKLITTSSEARTEGSADEEGNAEIYYEGECLLGAVATLENGGSFVWYSSSDIVDDSINSYYPGGVLVSLLTFQKFCAKDTTISLAAKKMSIAPLTVDETSANFLGTLFTTVIPVSIIILGVVIWLFRRNK